MIRAVAYYRKSNEDGGDSVEQQQAWAREACPAAGIELVREFTDQAKQGWNTAARGDFHAMLAFCQQQQRRGAPVEAVVCWHPNRFSRADSIETSWFVHEFRKAGVGRMFTAQGWIDFDRMEDRIIFGITQDASNHRYVLDLSQAASRGKLKAAEDGRWNGGPPPYAYRVLYDEKRRPVRLVLGPDEEVETVRWMFHTYATTGATIRGLVAQLNARGVPGPAGGKWGAGSVKRILNHRAYLGEIVWNQRHCGRFFGVIDCKVAPAPKQRGKSRNPEADWVRRDGRHEAIIDVATWERVQAKLVENRTRTGPNKGNVFLFSGLLRCGHCGRRMIGRNRVVRHPYGTYGYMHYLCGGHNVAGDAVCTHKCIDQAKLLPAVLRKLQEGFFNPTTLEALREKVRSQDAEALAGNGREAAALEKHLAALERQVATATRRMSTEEDDALVPQLRADLLELVQERDDLAGRLEAAKRSRPDPARLEALVDAALAFAGRLEEAAALADPEAVREMLRQLVARVELWFGERQCGKAKRYPFARGLIYLRTDHELGDLLTCADLSRASARAARGGSRT
jgi:DNA invertase Pin-like site-specific DNA recombinase